MNQKNCYDRHILDLEIDIDLNIETKDKDTDNIRINNDEKGYRYIILCVSSWFHSYSYQTKWNKTKHWAECISGSYNCFFVRENILHSFYSSLGFAVLWLLVLGSN